jgi:hypothetical protein
MEGEPEPLCHGRIQQVWIFHSEAKDGGIYPTHHTWVSRLRKNSVYT